MAKKILLLCAVLLVLTTFVAFAGGGGEGTAATGKWTKTVQVSLMGNGPVIKPAVEDVLTPLWRQMTGVTATLRGYPPDMTEASLIASALVAAGDIPSFLGRHIIPPNEEAIKIFVDKGLLWEFSADNLKKYMPKFVARINQYGDFNTWLKQEIHYQDKNWAMSAGMSVDSMSKLAKVIGADNPFMIDQGASYGATYSLGLRDDIMKQIFPNARSYKEQGDFYVSKNGKVDPKDAYSDIPINSLADLMSYMQKAKDIIDKQSMMVGTDKMIAGIPWCTSCGGGDTLGWSFSTFYGYAWNEPPWFVVDPEPKVYYVFSQDSFKTGLKWANEAYNKGLIDPEVFVKQGDQATADYQKGRYAVIHGWQTGDANNQLAAAKATFRYRHISAWWPDTAHGATSILKGPFEDISNFPTTYHTHSGLIMTKTVKEEDLPQVFNWIDLAMSEEGDVLHNWGPPSFYTGTGKDRRFKPEYKAIEDQKVYNITTPGAKDGYYYGISYGSPNWDSAYLNEETYPVYYFAAWGPYPESPQYVYPHKAAITDDFQAKIYAQWCNGNKAHMNFYPMVGWSQQADLLAIPDFARVRYLLFAKSAPEIANIIRGSTADFEANWAHMRKIQEDEGLQNALDQVSAKWKEIYNKYVKQYWNHDQK